MEENQGKLLRVQGGDHGVPLCHHMERAHGIVLPYNREVDVGGGGPETYRVSFP